MSSVLLSKGFHDGRVSRPEITNAGRSRRKCFLPVHCPAADLNAGAPGAGSSARDLGCTAIQGPGEAPRKALAKPLGPVLLLRTHVSKTETTVTTHECSFVRSAGKRSPLCHSH
ncbi:hypothetical protein AAFF_G00261040 [Aldrovandia affinis]|uniref:Uncharacterized protein n=1 Tax=Aldrovandia affinis TaxID=143900 RepID=A0AAD7W2L7_9TELE|nr:hypothetical protein AAFF_G00261040 [Aldrovandia affinis]